MSQILRSTLAVPNSLVEQRYILDVRTSLQLTFWDLFLLPASNVNSIRHTGWFVCLKTLSYSTLAQQTFQCTNTSPHVRESRRVLDSGFHTVNSGFRVLDSGFLEALGSKFFCVCFNAFLRISFSCLNRAVLKNVVRKQNKFVFFFDLQIMGLNVLHFFKSL